MPIFQLTNSEKNSYGPALVVDSENIIHMTWTDQLENDTTRNVYYQQFKGSTLLLEHPVKVNKIHYSNPYQPVIAIDDNDNPHIVWEEENNESLDVIFYRALEQDAAETEVKQISGTGVSFFPSICCDTNGRVHITWDEVGNLMHKSSDQQRRWVISEQLTFNDSFVVYPQVAVDKIGNVHIVWCDYTSGNSWQVYYIKGKMSNLSLLIGILVPSFMTFILLGIGVSIIRKNKRLAKKKI